MTTTLEIAEAQRLDQRIRLLAGQIGDSLTKLYGLVEQAKAGDIHLALGYPSWPAYIADACKIQMKVDRHTRRELVGWLSSEGMSQRAIADVVGTSVGTVNADLGVQNRTPTPADEAVKAEEEDVVDPDEIARGLDLLVSDGSLAPEDAEGFKRDLSESKSVGLDGKTYTRPQPEVTARRRRPITEAFNSATYDLSRVARRIESLADDDRFAKNVSGMQHRISDLIRARDALDRVIGKFEGGER